MAVDDARPITAGDGAGAARRRILLRTPKNPFDVASPTRVFRENLIGRNSGNLVFLQAAWKLLGARGVTIESDRFHIPVRATAEIDERFDVYVIPLANAFRISYESHLVQMAAMIRRLKIPVVVLGVGAQGDLDGSTERIRTIEPAVRSFVDAVLDHGPAIGVRGEATFDYLRMLGYRDVEIIGCPSMFFHGGAMPVAKRVDALGPESRIALNVSPYVKAMGPIVAHNVARYRNLVYIPQDLDTLGLLLGASRHAPSSVQGDIPDYVDHPLFRQDRVRFYVEPWPWIEDLRAADFSFGSRIHGNITALIAGTPAYVLAHDSRTLELARWFSIPHRLITETDGTLDAAELYEDADYTALVNGHPARFAAFQAYLRLHGLADCFSDGDSGAAFDVRITEVAFPGAVTAGPVGLGERFIAILVSLKHQAGDLARHRILRRARARVRRALVARGLGRH